MIILALDAALKKTGWCVGDDAGHLIAAGLVMPDAALAPVPRSFQSAREVWALVEKYRPDQFVIETPAPQAPVIYGSEGGIIPQRGQADYGMGVMAIIMALHLRRLAGPDGKAMPRIPADYPRADVWTRGSKKKHRMLITKSEWPDYDPRKDPGMDVSDAVQLWRWWILDRRIKAARIGQEVPRPSIAP